MHKNITKLKNLWFNKLIIIGNAIVNFTKLSQKKNQFLEQLVNESCQFRKWQTLKDEYHLGNDMYFHWTQWIQASPQVWKKQNKTKRNKKWKQSSHKKCYNPNTRQTYGKENIFNLDFSSQKPTNFSKLRWKFVSELHLWLEANLLVITNNNYQ